MKKRAIDSIRCYLVILVIVIFQTLANCQFEGEVCYHETRKTNGVCKLLTDCQIAIQDLRAGKFPQKCGFQGTMVIACCPQVATTITTTTTTRTTAATTKTPIIGPLPVGEKAKRACKTYAKLGYKLEYQPISQVDVGPEEVENCPWEPQALTVIIRGTRATQGEFPHMALIGYGTSDNYEWRCGGILISDKFILTAAHCLFARDLGEAQVARLGDLNYTDPNDNQYVQQIKIKTLRKHPDYKPQHYYNDIALLELEKPARLSVFVKPACLQINYLDEPAGIITGWGYTEHGTPSEHLLKATVQRFTPQFCKEVYMNSIHTLWRGIDENQQICYGYKTSSTDSCQGDSGGPIQVYADFYCSYYVLGITSFGKGCGLEGSPGVYVKLSYYIEWIENLVWP